MTIAVWIIAAALVWIAFRITLWLNDNPILDLRSKWTP
jgi:hypothetical protein